MNIEIGKYYVNKTWRFLLPCLRGHGDLFIKKFNPLFKLAVGVHDTLLDNSPCVTERAIYIMINKTVQPSIYDSFAEWIKFQDYYILDYCPDADISTSKKHVFVLKIPEMFNNAYDMFLKGEYSKMYTKKQIDSLFLGYERKKEHDILLKKESQLDVFVKNVNKEFGTDIDKKDFVNAELEMPLKKLEEIFHCSDTSSIFFNDETYSDWKYKKRINSLK